MKRHYFIFIIVVSLIPAQVMAQQCDETRPATTPDRVFIMHEDGTVKDTRSGLLWMRCALGQSWREGRCAFSHITYEFYEAEEAAGKLNRQGGFAGHRNWRVPTLDELASIVEQRCEDPALNTRAFPDNPVTGYWSSSEDPDYLNGGMLVHLLNGHSYMGNKKGDWGLRLVSDGR